METNVDKEREMKVAKSNDLILKSRYSLTMQQQKMLLYMISKVKPMDAATTIYTFDVQDFCNAVGLMVDSGGVYYRTIKRNIKTIADASVWVKVNGHEKLLRWIDAATLDIKDGSGTIAIRFSELVQPYLFELRQNYTQYPLHEVLPLQSKYSIRLYEILKSIAYGRKWNNYQRIENEFTREQLYTLMDAETYDRYNDFKKRALIPAIEDINRYSEEFSIVDMIEQKEGKTVKYITFVLDHPMRAQLRGAEIEKIRKLNRG